MATYKIIITEHNICEVEVQADNREQALEIAESAYWEHPEKYCFDCHETDFEIK